MMEANEKYRGPPIAANFPGEVKQNGPQIEECKKGS